VDRPKDALKNIDRFSGPTWFGAAMGFGQIPWEKRVIAHVKGRLPLVEPATLGDSGRSLL
jgi:hypothetical protein